MGPDQVHWQLRLSVGRCWRDCGVRSEELWWLQGLSSGVGCTGTEWHLLTAFLRIGRGKIARERRLRKRVGEWGCSGREGVGVLRKRRSGG